MLRVYLDVCLAWERDKSRDLRKKSTKFVFKNVRLQCTIQARLDTLKSNEINIKLVIKCYKISQKLR